MPGYSLPTRETDPVHQVRTIGRLAQMVLELRDEYVRELRADTLDQILRRIEEINHIAEALREQIRAENEAAAYADEETA
jgi:hypothetical protein